MKRFAAVLFFFIAFLYNGYARADGRLAAKTRTLSRRMGYPHSSIIQRLTIWR